MNDEVLKNLQTGVEILSDTAQIIAPAVAIYNPGLGLALGSLAPIVEKFIITEAGALIVWKTNLTQEEMNKALIASKSVNWGIPGSIEPDDRLNPK